MKKKICRICGLEKDEEEFHWRWIKKDKRHTICKSCQSEKGKAWYQENRREHITRSVANAEKNRKKSRKWVWNYLKIHPCQICGEDDPVVLEFHHQEEFEKVKHISQMIAQGYSIKSIAYEISKCQVLCSNCHRKVTSRQRGWFSG